MLTSQHILQLSDADLLEYICTTDNGEVAYQEFVNRYIKEVGEICKKLCKWRKLDEHIGLQITHDAFEKVRRLKSYRKDTSRSNEKKAILGFFYIVCLNLFNDYYNKQKNKGEYVSQPNYFDQISESLKDKPQSNEERKEITAKILKKLNQKEIRVITVDIEYKRHQKYLPDEVISLLCEELNVKEAGIRKIRERAITKIKKEIDVINGQQ